MNLLQETIEAVAESGHTPDQIVFIGSRVTGHSCTWDEFVVLADREYESGFGSQKVAEDLLVLFSDGQTMWRHEYDGSEQWMFSEPFEPPVERKPIRSLFVVANQVGWKALSEIDEELDRLVGP